MYTVLVMRIELIQYEPTHPSSSPNHLPSIPHYQANQWSQSKLGTDLYYSNLTSDLQAVTYLPGVRVPFQSLALPGAILPTSWWNPGVDFPWVRRCESLYRHYTYNHTKNKMN